MNLKISLALFFMLSQLFLIIEAGAVEIDCSSYGEWMYERSKKGEWVSTYFKKLNHGPKEALDADHIANLVDSDFSFENELEKNVIRPSQDISKLLKVAPLGDEPLDSFDTIKLVKGPIMVPTNVYGLPDKAVSKVREGAFELERFSRMENGAARSFNIFYVSGQVGDYDALLRSMRARVNLTDAEMEKYGVQFAVRDNKGCRTLSYAADKNGRIGLVYTNGFGNFLSATENSTLVSAYGETAQRRIWHKLRGRTQADIKFYVQPDSDNLGLVSVLEQDLMTVYRGNDFALVNDTFEKTGPNTMTFGEVARECTKLGLNKYDEYQKRGDGRFPVLYDFITGCLKNSNFKIVRSSHIQSIRTRLTFQRVDNESKEFYVRKYKNKDEKTFERYSAVDLVEEADECVVNGALTIDAVTTCLNGKNYQIVATDEIKPRVMYRIESRKKTGIWLKYKSVSKS